MNFLKDFLFSLFWFFILISCGVGLITGLVYTVTTIRQEYGPYWMLVSLVGISSTVMLCFLLMTKPRKGSLNEFFK